VGENRNGSSWEDDISRVVVSLLAMPLYATHGSKAMPSVSASWNLGEFSR
jgi:hypothetical protein